ncbi:NHLP-related RiPP peptide [Pseudoxanthomonas daejeonensis]|nr:NHLP-related RiPP peptide [Pseudoxanthomonas daejeonensis]
MSDKIPGASPTPLPPDVAERLLDLLSTDDEFRQLFAKDPVSALLKAGYKPSDEDLKQLRSNMKVGSLASKDEIASGRDELKSSLTSLLCMHPIQLNAGSSGQKSE